MEERVYSQSIHFVQVFLLWSSLCIRLQCIPAFCAFFSLSLSPLLSSPGRRFFDPRIPRLSTPPPLSNPLGVLLTDTQFSCFIAYDKTLPLISHYRPALWKRALHPLGLILPIMGQKAKCTIWMRRVRTRSLCINKPSDHPGFGLILVSLQT